MRLRSFALALLLIGTSAACTAKAHCQENARSILTQAEQTATHEGKNILVTFGASWCSNCHLLDKMFADPKVDPSLPTPSYTST